MKQKQLLVAALHDIDYALAACVNARFGQSAKAAKLYL